MRNSITLAVLLGATLAATAQNPVFWVDRFDQAFIQGNAPTGWTSQSKVGTPIVQLEKCEGGQCIRMSCDRASFGIYKEMDFDIKDYPYLNWKWKVTKLPTGGNFKRSETDDQAAQLCVAFPRFPARINTNFVCYYWESEPSNHNMMGTSVAWSKAKIAVLQAGKEKLNQWVTEKRNVYDDYRRLFDREPPRVGGMAFYINSQHTRSEGESFIDEIYFSKN